MLGTLIRKEILRHLLTLRFAATFMLILLLGSISMSLSSNMYRRNREEYQARARSYRQALDELEQEEDYGDRWDGIFWRQGKSQAVPPGPLSAVAQGLTEAYPAGITAYARVDNQSSVDRSRWRNPLMGLYDTPDVVYVVSVIISLLAILFVFDAVSGEKEAGTLRLMLSNPLPRHTVLLAKWLGGLATLMVPFVLMFVAGAGYCWAKGTLSLEGDHVIRLVMILVAAALYVSVFFTLGLFISCCTHRSTTSLFLSLFVWAGLVLAIPNMAPVLAKIVVPAPARAEVEAEKRAVDQEIGLRLKRLAMVSGELNYGEKMKLEREKLEQEGKERKARWDRYLKDSVRQQGMLASVLGRVSPSAIWVYAATELAHTGATTFSTFDAAWRRMTRAMADKHDALASIRRASDWEEEPELDFDDLPSLRLSYPGFAQTMDSVLNDLLLLVVLNVVLFMSAFARFLRYDVR